MIVSTINEVITAAIGMGLMVLFYLAWLASGAFSVAFNKDRKWSWKRFFEDFLKLILRCFGIIIFIVACNVVIWYADRIGADITSLMDTIGTAGVLLLILKATLSYAEKAYRNFEAFFSQKFTDSTQSIAITEEPDYAGLIEDAHKEMKKIADAITPKQAVDEEQTASEAEPTAEEMFEAGRGADVNPLSRILPDGDNDNGKGWQCSKYAWYLATGIRMNYAPHPDYGPCNGNEMVDYLIKQLGWVECPKQNGAIFCYAAGAFGHTGIVKDAASNLVNDANWNPLRVGTHTLNLDAVGARYACPRFMFVEPAKPEPEPTPAPTPSPAPALAPAPSEPAADSAIKVGDIVRPMRLVDYDGRKLTQWDDSYTVIEVIGDRAVLSARGQVWAAMRVGDVVKC